MARTIDWIPKRLNAPPVVFRGMTMREIGIMLGLGLAVFTPVGILSAVVFRAIAMVPTVAFAGAGLFLWFGGTVMRRLRRGRPTALLYRNAQFALARRGIQPPGETLITRTSVYCIRRKSKPRT
ncbi:TIGR03750 family conjugal transfer protein [Azotobacter vinelandii]|uniref:TIGR03750 family conjugal transfer protein n=1 Tax=Azotobacter vinelandii TaxID=354 RepID=UPI0007738FA3|nr:TIGR03750 family conjugal transfer protein [Azotobacter vinelandii]